MMAEGCLLEVLVRSLASFRSGVLRTAYYVKAEQDLNPWDRAPRPGFEPGSRE